MLPMMLALVTEPNNLSPPALAVILISKVFKLPAKVFASATSLASLRFLL